MGLLGISAFTGRKLYTLTLYFLITGLFIVSLVFAQTDGGEKQGSINTSSFQFGDPVQLTPEENLTSLTLVMLPCVWILTGNHMRVFLKMGIM